MRKKNSGKSCLKAVFALVLLFTPLFLFFIFWYLFSRISSLLLFIAGFGAFITGVALLIAYLSFLTKKPEGKLAGWIPCAIFLAGAFISAVPSMLLFDPKAVEKINENQIAVYILCAGVFLILFIYYWLFRLNIQAYYVENGFRKRDVRLLSQGWRNYWFYEKLNDQKSMGSIRFPLIVSTCLYVTLLCVYVLFGWWKPVLIFVGVFLAALCILNGVLIVWTRSKVNNKKSNIAIAESVVLSLFAIGILGMGLFKRVCELL